MTSRGQRDFADGIKSRLLGRGDHRGSSGQPPEHRPTLPAVVRWSNATVEEGQRKGSMRSAVAVSEMQGAMSTDQRKPPVKGQQGNGDLGPRMHEQSSANHANEKTVPPSKSPERPMWGTHVGLLTYRTV